MKACKFCMCQTLSSSGGLAEPGPGIYGDIGADLHCTALYRFRNVRDFHKCQAVGMAKFREKRRKRIIIEMQVHMHKCIHECIHVGRHTRTHGRVYTCIGADM